MGAVMRQAVMQSRSGVPRTGSTQAVSTRRARVGRMRRHVNVVLFGPCANRGHLLEQAGAVLTCGRCRVRMPLEEPANGYVTVCDPARPGALLAVAALRPDGSFTIDFGHPPISWQEVHERVRRIYLDAADELAETPAPWLPPDHTAAADLARSLADRAGDLAHPLAGKGLIPFDLPNQPRKDDTPA